MRQRKQNQKAGRPTLTRSGYCALHKHDCAPRCYEPAAALDHGWASASPWWLGTDEDVTNALVNQARKEANKVLARGNYYLKPRSKQLAATDMQTDAFNVASQAILYSTAQDAKGCDLRPLRSMEFDLINLADAANSTHNMLSGQEAQFQAAGVPARVVGSLKAAIPPRPARLPL